MPAKDPLHKGPDFEGLPDEHSFDKMARGLASGNLSRGQALKLVAATIFGGTFGVFGLEKPAEARRRRCRRCSSTRPCPSGTCCQTRSNGKSCCVRSCPSGEACAGGNCCDELRACGDVCCPSDQCCGGDGNCCPPGNTCCSAISAQPCCGANERCCLPGCCTDPNGLCCPAGSEAPCCPEGQECCPSGSTVACAPTLDACL